MYINRSIDKQIIYLYNRMHVLACKVASVMSLSDSETLRTQPTRLLCPWDSSRQEYWSGLPFSPPGDLTQRLNPCFISPALAGRFFTTSATWEAPYNRIQHSHKNKLPVRLTTWIYLTDILFKEEAKPSRVRAMWFYLCEIQERQY